MNSSDLCSKLMAHGFSDENTLSVYYALDIWGKKSERDTRVLILVDFNFLRCR